MTGMSLASPLLTCEAAACCSFSPSDLSTSTPNLALAAWSPSCRLRPNIQACVMRERSGSLRCASRRWKLRSVDHTQVAVVSDDEDKKTWEACKQALSALNFTVEESCIMLGKAFGWSHSPYWGEERKKEAPNDESVSGVLDYLRSLGLSDDDLHKLLKKFPEVLGCGLGDEVKPNVAALEKEWGIKGKALRNLLLRNPKVLGYNVDCKGDCMAKCTRCWVRF